MRGIVNLVAVAALVGASASAFAEDTKKTGSQQSKTIVWRTDSLKAYNEALQKNKPLVLVFVCPLDREACVHCKRMRGSLFSEELQKFADDAVFAMAEIRQDRSSADKSAAVFFSKLGMKATPTITVLKPNRHMIEEHGRMNGYFAVGDLAKHLAEMLRTWKEVKPNASHPAAR
jgi:thiol:disulfide interchange protein